MAETPPHSSWMLTEIHQQPEALSSTFGHYAETRGFRADVTAAARQWLAQTNGEMVIVASGSSRHAAMVAELLIEDLSGIAVDVEYASEYCYRSEKALKHAAVLVISQSGETADTLAAMRKARSAGHRTLAVTNAPDSTMAREATVSFPTFAGSERAIPATKSFTAQLLVLHLLALLAAEARGVLPTNEIQQHLQSLAALPEILRTHLPAWEAATRNLAEKYHSCKNFLFLGRGVHYPIAREGALKLKESSYVHAEGYPSGELKHGPNALVSEDTPVVVIATVDRNDADSVQRYEKTLHLLKDMRQQGTRILCLANEGDTAVSALADDVLFTPYLSEFLLPFAEVIYFQFFAYFMAVQAGIDVDHPRNLVKAVVTE